MTTDVLSLTLAEVSSAIRSGENSSVEVTHACLEAIDRHQSFLNSFVAVEAHEALREAAEADGEIAAGRWRGPLHGVPLAHKDMFYRKGKVSSCGSKICRDQVATVTATVHDRLSAAGAVNLGRLNMSEFAAGPTGHNEFFGHCRNPWNTAHVTGGSSSGSGASVAARLLFGSLGSDTGGSIRLPAAMCGVTGLKPTYGLVSRFGVMPRCWSLDVVGPIARTSEDCALLLQAVAGPDVNDSTTAKHGAFEYSAVHGQIVRGIRIGVPVNDMFDDVDVSIRRLLDDSLAVLKDCGAKIVPIELPDPRLTYALTNIVNKAEAAAIHAKWRKSRSQDYSLSAVNRFEVGYHIPAAHYLDATRIRGRLLQQFADKVFGQVDVVHMPVLGFEVPTIDATEIRTTASVPQLMERITRHTRWVNYLGLPALSVPCGFSPGALPVGFQLMGRPFSEARLCAMGSAYQAQTDWHRKRPPEADRANKPVVGQQPWQ